MTDESDKGRKLRPKERRTYNDLDIDEDDIEGRRTFCLEEKLESDKYNEVYVKEMSGSDVSLKLFQENGFSAPILVREKTGLAMRMPSLSFTVSDVKSGVGSRRLLDVVDVTTQKAMEMSMKEWVRYYENNQRDRLLNVISLEFSHTKLDNYVQQPAFVRQLDWVDTVWPQHLKECQTESTNIIQKMKYPKVQKYCLMSVKSCYTDFHIDMGGTSVWYHILRGSKVFWLIPPTEKNLELYENWTLSGKQGDMFFADQVDGCQRINLEAGNTFFIPTGWIHAVFTPEDSLVFGGNFLHSLNVEMQLRIWDVEERTHVPLKFRYPFFQEIHWYVLDRYLSCVWQKSYREKSPDELCDEKGKKIKSESPVDSTDDRGDTGGGSSLDDYNVKDESPAGFERCRSPILEEHSYGSPLPPRSPLSAPQSPKMPSSPRPKQGTSSDGSKKLNPSDLIKPVSVKLENCMIGGRLTPTPPPKKGHINLTSYEVEGLRMIANWLEKIPANKKLVPRDITDPEALIADTRKMLSEHESDDQKVACTGETILKWPKRRHKAKIRTYTTSYVKLSGAKPVKNKDKEKESSSTRRRRVRCKKCEPCRRNDCEECSHCKDMKKYGGPGRMKQSCLARQCMNPELPNSALCAICGTDDRDEDAEPGCVTKLMECGICWEILHPDCLSKQLPPEVEMESTNNEDLPNSWECPKCCHDGKQGQLKPRLLKGVKKLERSSSSEEDGRTEYTDDDGPRRGRPLLNKDSKPDSPNPEGKPLGRPRGRPAKNKVENSDGIPSKKLKTEEGEKMGRRGPGRPSAWQDWSSTDDDTDDAMQADTEAEEYRVKQENLDAGETLKIPAQKYVVRPAPIPAPPKYVETEEGRNHVLHHEVWMNVFKYLTPSDLCACMRVCRIWNRWCIDRHLWANINLSRRRITKDHLVGVVRRQPRRLDLSFSNISRRQLEWLVSRLPQLRHLVLAGNSWAAVSALCSSSCPLLFTLDLQWVQGIRDPCLRDLLSPPTDHRPGVDDTISRLHRLQVLLLAGSDISDASIKVVIQHLTRLNRLDLSYCTMVTDAGVALLAADTAPTRINLAELDLTGCNQLTEACFTSLSKFSSLQTLILQHCPHITAAMCAKFIQENPKYEMCEPYRIEVKIL